MDAGAADLDQAGAQVTQAGDVEFVFGVIADAPGVVRGQDAVGADDLAVVLVTGDEVVAEGIEDVVIDVSGAA